MDSQTTQTTLVPVRALALEFVGYTKGARAFLSDHGIRSFKVPASPGQAYKKVTVVSQADAERARRLWADYNGAPSVADDPIIRLLDKAQKAVESIGPTRKFSCGFCGKSTLVSATDKSEAPDGYHYKLQYHKALLGKTIRVSMAFEIPPGHMIPFCDKCSEFLTQIAIDLIRNVPATPLSIREGPHG